METTTMRATPGAEGARSWAPSWIADTQVHLVLAAAMVVAAGFSLWLGRDTSFSGDELNWIIDTPGLDVDGAVQPHGGGHLILVSRLLYDAIVHVSGVDYLPFRLLTVGTVVLTAGLFFVFASRRIGALAALAPTLVLLVYGPDSTHALQGSGFTVIFPLATGIGALLALEREDRAGDVIACSLLVLGLATYSTGIPFVAGAAVLIMIGSDRWRRAWVFLVPSVLYGAWLLWSNLETAGGAGSQATLSNILLFPSWAWDSLATAGAALVGLGYEFSGRTASPDRLEAGWGAVVAAIALGGLAWRLWRGPIQKWLWAMMAIPATLWLIGAVGALGTPLDVPDSTRYLFPGGIAVLLVAVEATRGVRLGPTALVAIYGVAAIALATNIRLLGEGAAGLRDGLALQRAGLTSVELAGGRIGAEFGGEQVGRVLRSTGEGGVASGYLAAVREFGSPAFSLSELKAQPEPVRQEADRLLADNLGVRLEQAPGAPTGCREVRGEPGAGTSVALPRGGAVLRSPSASEVRLRRFGAAFPAEPVGRLAADVSTSLVVPGDLVPDPWYVGVSGAELEICDPVAPPS
jgi:hypothetical protein